MKALNGLPVGIHERLRLLPTSEDEVEDPGLRGAEPATRTLLADWTCCYCPMVETFKEALAELRQALLVHPAGSVPRHQGARV